MTPPKPHFKDNVRKTLKCEKCHHVLAKVDADGTVHYKPFKGPELFIIAKALRIMFKCEGTFFKKDQEHGLHEVRCGNATHYQPAA